MINYLPKKHFWVLLLVYAIIAAVAYGAVYYFIFYKKGGDSYSQTINSPNKTADWKTYRNDEYGFEFKYPQSVVVNNQNQYEVGIADTTDGYTVNWGLRLYKNDSSENLATWLKSTFFQYNSVGDKDCKMLASDAYGPKVEIKDALTILVTQTSDFDELCIDQGYYVISSDNTTIVKFEDVIQASPGHLQDIVSTFKFTK